MRGDPVMVGNDRGQVTRSMLIRTVWRAPIKREIPRGGSAAAWAGCEEALQQRAKAGVDCPYYRYHPGRPLSQHYMPK